MTTRKSKSKKSNKKSQIMSPFPLPHNITMPPPKMRDLYWDASAVSSGGALNSLFTMTTALGSDTRLGNTIRGVGLEWRLVFSPSSTDGNNIIRFMVVESYGPGLLLADMPEINRGTNLHLYKVWHDEMITLAAVENSSNGPGTFKKARAGKLSYTKTITFNGPNNTDLTCGTLWVYFVSDSAVVPNPTVDGYMRSYFRDVF